MTQARPAQLVHKVRLVLRVTLVRLAILDRMVLLVRLAILDRLVTRVQSEQLAPKVPKARRGP